MTLPGWVGETWATVSLRRSRGLVASGVGRLLALTSGLVYGFLALLVGQMLVFGPTGSSRISITVLQQGTPWWNFPMYVVIAPNAILVLPYFAALTMLLVSAGIAVGMGVALVLTFRLLRHRRENVGRPAAAGSVAGLTPALIALVTLGACCSTTAAATAGIGIVAQASGTTVDTLLANTWYLGVFQLAVLWVALIAQERLVTVFAPLLEPTPAGAPAALAAELPVVSWRSGLVRVALLVGGLAWAMTIVADWTTLAPGRASAVDWGGWLLLRLVPAVAAVGAALAPGALARNLVRLSTTAQGAAVRGLWLAAGVLLLIGVPPPLASTVVHGLGNELLGQLGWPASAGGITLPGVGGIALAFRWLVEMLLTGLFCVALALSPARAVRPLLGGPPVSVGASPQGPVAASAVGNPAPEGRAGPSPEGVVPVASPAGPEREAA